MSKLAKVAALAETARRVTLPQHIEGWERDGITAERVIRDLRRDLRREIARNPDIVYTSTAGIRLSPEWEDGRIVGYEVSVPVGFIKP